jgi:hypothetical protein
LKITLEKHFSAPLLDTKVINDNFYVIDSNYIFYHLDHNLETLSQYQFTSKHLFSLAKIIDENRVVIAYNNQLKMMCKNEEISENFSWHNQKIKTYNTPRKTDN